MISVSQWGVYLKALSASIKAQTHVYGGHIRTYMLACNFMSDVACRFPWMSDVLVLMYGTYCILAQALVRCTNIHPSVFWLCPLSAVWRDPDGTQGDHPVPGLPWALWQQSELRLEGFGAWGCWYPSKRDCSVLEEPWKNIDVCDFRVSPCSTRS